MSIDTRTPPMAGERVSRRAPPPASPTQAATVVEMFREACAKYGGTTAFQEHARDGHFERLSFTELGKRADAFAADLLARGLQHGDRVGIVCENRLDWPVAYYGIAVAGGVAVPVYAELPGAEIETLLARAGARFLVASAKVMRGVTPSRASIEHTFVIGDLPGGTDGGGGITPFSLAARADGAAPVKAPPTVVPDDLASIVFTSGTTGGPKGVMLTHRNFMVNVEATARVMSVGSSDRLLLVLPLHHAFPFMIGVLLAVGLGGEVTLEHDPTRVRQRVTETRPTVFMGVPAMFEIMHRNVQRRVERMGRAKQFERAMAITRLVKNVTGINIGRLLFRQVHRQLGGSLRFMFSGGSALNPEIGRQFMLLGIPILQGWGLTETAPVVTAQRWSPWRFYFTRYYERRLGSVGTPLPGVEVSLIDVPEKSLRVDVDGQGELIVRGANVTPGYWQAEDKTREALMGEWLKTGDIGRIDREGNVWITGRRKYVMVLDSGEKVHPDKVETALSLSPLIEDVTIVQRSVRGRTPVCAMIYPAVESTLEAIEKSGLARDEAGVRDAVAAEVERLGQELAPHERPTHIMISDTPLPKTAIRKIARERLPENPEFSYERWLATKPEEVPEEAS